MTKDIEETKKKLLEKHAKRLDEFFAKETFEMTFDAREKMIYGGMEKDMCDILDWHLQEDPHSIVEGQCPEETIVCSCGRTATLIRDDKGNPRVHEKKIMTRTGPVTVREYGYYCASERKLFSPLSESS